MFYILLLYPIVSTARAVFYKDYEIRFMGKGMEISCFYFKYGLWPLWSLTDLFPSIALYGVESTLSKRYHVKILVIS